LDVEIEQILSPIGLILGIKLLSGLPVSCLIHDYAMDWEKSKPIKEQHSNAIESLVSSATHSALTESVLLKSHAHTHIVWHLILATSDSSTLDHRESTKSLFAARSFTNQLTVDFAFEMRPHQHFSVSLPVYFSIPAVWFTSTWFNAGEKTTCSLGQVLPFKLQLHPQCGASHLAAVSAANIFYSIDFNPKHWMVCGPLKARITLVENEPNFMVNLSLLPVSIGSLPLPSVSVSFVDSIGDERSALVFNSSLGEHMQVLPNNAAMSSLIMVFTSSEESESPRRRNVVAF
jgi:hypothetical protein